MHHHGFPHHAFHLRDVLVQADGQLLAHGVHEGRDAQVLARDARPQSGVHKELLLVF